MLPSPTYDSDMVHSRTGIDSDLQEIIRNGLREDIGNGDITTLAIVSEDSRLKARISAKEEGVVAGIGLLELVFREMDVRILCTNQVGDGKFVSAGTTIALIQGPARGILSGERVALNFLQRMSGIATQTRKFVDAVKGTKAIVLDTRKTAPGLRLFDKLAVTIGGGTNHRLGLFDMYLIKENHIAAAGSLTEAVRRLRTSNSGARRIEVEVSSLSQLEEALSLEVDQILLDNMPIEQIRAAVKQANNKIPLEASGNITLDNIRQVAETGVDFISVGLLTHSVQAMDLSLVVEGPE